MFKLVVSLALLALCHASLYPGGGYGHGYYVEVGDNHIVVSNQAGQRVHIHTDHKHIGGTGHFVQLHVSGPGVVLKSEQYVHHPVTFEGPFQTDVLYLVFNQFSGPLDEAAYDKLVHAIHQHVQDGSVHPAVLYALRMLAHHHQSMDLVDPEHQEIYKAVQKLFDHSGVEKDVLFSKYNQAGSWYGHHAVGDYDKLHGVGDSHDYSHLSGVYGSHGLSHQSYQPGVYGSHDLSHESYQPGFYGLHGLSHESYQPGVYGLHGLSHESYQPGVYGSHDLSHQSYQPGVYGSHQGGIYGSHQSYYPHVYGSHDSSSQSYGSQYPWGKRSYESHYPYSASSHSYGSHYPVGAGVHSFGQSSLYPRDWSHQSYGSQYPVHGQSWGEHSYAGPYSSGLYDSHGVGSHHWGQTGLWSPWHGVNAVQQPHVVV